MERGLFWLPLLILFIWLAWSGWNEYQKIEAYRVWAANFDKSKYDIYAVLGHKNNLLIWGKPTRQGIINAQELNLNKINKVELIVDGKVIENLENLPTKGSVNLVLNLKNEKEKVVIPFTEISLAAEWKTYLDNIVNS